MAEIELTYGKSKLAVLVSTHCRRKELGILTPASPDSLPPLGELIADEPFWHYPVGTTDRQGVTHLRVWLTAGRELGHLAVVTETGSAASVTESAGQIWSELARRYGPSLVLLEHHTAPEAGEGRARIVDGGSRAPDRRQARELLRLTRALGRLN